MLQYAKKLGGKIVRYRNRQALLSRVPSETMDIIGKIKQEKLTYLSEVKLASIADSCKAAEEAEVPGVFIEAGCALGGSAILLALLKKVERPMYVYDVFELIPAPTANDTKDVHERHKLILDGKAEGIDGDKYYGYKENLYEIVNSNFDRFGVNCKERSVSLVKGLVQDTLEIAQPVSLAHIDVDYYLPVMTCLERIFPNLISGGCIILDDYNAWGGCRKATDEYLQRVPGQYELDYTAGSLKVIKK